MRRGRHINIVREFIKMIYEKKGGYPEYLKCKDSMVSLIKFKNGSELYE
jgi:hypothetical protein